VGVKQDGGLPCPACAGQDSVVLDSRAAHQAIRRRRRCVKCGHRWTTYEMGGEVFKELHKMLDDLVRQEGFPATLFRPSMSPSTKRSSEKLVRRKPVVCSGCR
jgi:transcriptional repressor NrdR